MAIAGDCEGCGHAWVLHPVAIASVFACVECMWEEDNDVRQDICRRHPDDDNRRQR